MFCVHYCNTGFEGQMEPACRLFAADKMTDALAFMELLRSTAEVDGVHFVCMASENPQHVGKMGVAQVDESYSWTKRRNNFPGARKR